jgi:hypothetical protein
VVRAVVGTVASVPGCIVIRALAMNDTVMLTTNVICRVVAALPGLRDGGNGDRRGGHERQ